MTIVQEKRDKEQKKRVMLNGFKARTSSWSLTVLVFSINRTLSLFSQLSCSIIWVAQVDEKAAEFQNAQSTPEESSSVSQDRHRNRLRGRVKRRARRAFWKVRSHIASRNGILPRRRPSRTGCRRSANKSGASIVGQSLQKEHQTEQLVSS